MGIVEHTGRPPLFEADVKKYGSGGENLFISIESDKILRKGYKIFNVTNDSEYQRVDVDFVVAKDNNIDSLPSIEKVLSDNMFNKVEVKVDTRALDTGNLPYECVSHGKPGWSFITKADYIYMILCEEGVNRLTAKKAMWIDMNEWNNFIKKHGSEHRVNYIQNEVIVDLLCKIENMENNGVIISSKNIDIPLENGNN
jgi:hypothetical protein